MSAACRQLDDGNTLATARTLTILNRFPIKIIEKTKIPLDIFGKNAIIGHVPDAGVAHPVERHLAKVEVASSSLVTRSKKKRPA